MYLWSRLLTNSIMPEQLLLTIENVARVICGRDSNRALQKKINFGSTRL